MVMKYFIQLLIPFTLVLCSAGPSAKVETFKYEVLLDGALIGTYLVNRTHVNGVAHFRVETNTAAGLIRRSEHKSVMLSSYQNDKLISSDLKTWINQKLESSMVICWDGCQYIKQGEIEQPDIGINRITFSSACLYFEEPLHKTSLFYEKYGKDLKVSRTGSHQYEIELPNASVERYTYEAGKLTFVEIVRSFATITLKPITS